MSEVGEGRNAGCVKLAKNLHLFHYIVSSWHSVGTGVTGEGRERGRRNDVHSERGSMVRDSPRETNKDALKLGSHVIEVTDFKCKVRFHLRGCMKAVVASEVIKRNHISNVICTHMDMEGIEVTDFKSAAKFDLRGRSRSSIGLLLPSCFCNL